MERSFPRVELPGVDRDEAKALKDQLAEASMFRFRYTRALLALGKHIYRNTVTGDERKSRRAAGKRQRAGRRAVR
ncbi:hypothetical protein OG474_09765 [Kribbella sp. NBC_01505]|uniref:hypothetical protein n=1 Tax=Kribbella sp. NBC_01505 TaxID=2903580 RepID=UPI00386F2E9C